MAEQHPEGQIIVLGMHRSGTSCVTGCLALAGAYSGAAEDLIEPQQDNPKGFWERRDIRAFCDAVLRGSGADWWKLSAFDLNSAPADVLRSAREDAAEILRRLNEREPWVIKEPRLCLLLPLMAELCRAPVIVHIYRNPLEVARSLLSRNGFQIHEGIALWDCYNRAAIRNAGALPTVRVDYGELLARTPETLADLLGCLEREGVSGLALPEEAVLREFVDQALHRQQSEPGEELEYLTPSQRELWDYLRRSNEDTPSHGIAPPTSAALASLEESRLLTAQRAELEKSVEALKAEGSRVYEALQRRDASLQEAGERHARLLEENRVLAGKLTERSDRVATLDAIVTRQRREREELERRGDRLKSELAAQEQSSAARLAAQAKEFGSKLEDLRASAAQAAASHRAELAEYQRRLDDRIRDIRALEDRLRRVPASVLAASELAFRITERLRRRSQVALLKRSPLFDADWYLRSYPDVAEAGGSPEAHYLEYGAPEGRDPGPGFSTRGYLESYPDVADSRLNPLVHYLRFGLAEGRGTGKP